ncbi:MAG TPA: preprotein translocase subunit SecE [Micropepsaceae bacterium]|nr:preprotein translocase subunit SecE [Micropepsaceae bacterium]
MAETPEKEEAKDVTPRVSAGAFLRQVRQEGSKVTWPTRKETTLTSVMVFIMVVISMIFFYLVDSIFALGIRSLITS